VLWQEIWLWVFRSTFWAFLCIFRVPISWSPWTRHHWKDLFLLQSLSIDDANFGQKWWRQKWKKGQGSSRAVTGGTGVNWLRILQIIFYFFWIKVLSEIIFKRVPSFKIFYRGKLVENAKKWFGCNGLQYTHMNEKETPSVLPMFTANVRGLNPKMKQIDHF